MPCDILKPYIQLLVIQENLHGQTYKVLPDTGIVIGFQYQGSLSHLTDNSERKLSTFGVSGLSDHFKIFKNSPNVGSVLIFFKEGGAAQFFKQPIHELFRESISLDHFLLRSELLQLEDKLQETKSDLVRIKAVESFLIRQMKNKEPDQLVLAALALIHKNNGNIRIKELTEKLHISQSPLEKRFREVVGTSPKKFSSIVRMKYTLKLYNSTLSLTELGYEAGYYDQSHFIKEFKNFTGETPESFFAPK
ncbi:MAG: AraC family transcriptional regulator [Cytophagales bacterium]|nr:AraC family transcriptional regulator [Cytophagales bacterium]